MKSRNADKNILEDDMAIQCTAAHREQCHLVNKTPAWMTYIRHARALSVSRLTWITPNFNSNTTRNFKPGVFSGNDHWRRGESQEESGPRKSIILLMEIG